MYTVVCCVYCEVLLSLKKLALFTKIVIYCIMQPPYNCHVNRSHLFEINIIARKLIIPFNIERLVPNHRKF